MHPQAQVQALLQSHFHLTKILKIINKIHIFAEFVYVAKIEFIQIRKGKF